MSDWKEVAKVVAPWIGAIATGGVPALVGVAASQISDAFGVTVASTTDGIAGAIATATPEQLVALKTAEANLQVKMQELGFTNIQSLEAIAATDRESARKRNIELKDYTPAILSYGVVLCFAAVLYLLFVHGANVSAELRDVAMVLIGTLASCFTQVMNFYLGTSASSSFKDKTIHQTLSSSVTSNKQ